MATGSGPSGASRELRSNRLGRQTEPLLRIPPNQIERWLCRPPRERRTKLGSRNGEGTHGEHQSMTLARDEGKLKDSDGMGGSVNGVVKQEEQPSANSTAPMAQELALQTNNQHQRQDSAAGSGTEIVLAAAVSARPVELSTKDSVFLPAMSMEVALARRSAIVEFTRRIMVKDQDFGEIPGTHKPTLLKPGAEKLCNFFGLEPEFTPIVEDIDWTGAQHGGEVFCYARYRCRLLREGRVVGVGEGSCNSWEAKYRYRWVAEEQVPEHLDRTRLLKRGGHRTLCEFDFAIERAETTGTYGKPAEHWQRFRDAIRTGTARSVEKLTRRGKSVAWEIDVDMALYRIPNPDVADVVNTIQKMAQKRALVAATLIATSASEFFTQDVEDADSFGGNVDTGSHPTGTREAQEYVRDRKLEELRPKPAVARGARCGREALEELRRDAPGVRAVAGAGGRDPLSGGTGTGRRPEPGSVPIGQQGVGMLRASRADRRATGGGVMAVLAVVPSPAVTAAPLYVIEDHLAALIETAELVSPEQEQEFRVEFQTALTSAVEKRDRVGQFLAHLEQQIDFARFEIDRLRQRKATYERTLARLERLCDRDHREPRNR